MSDGLTDGARDQLITKTMQETKKVDTLSEGFKLPIKFDIVQVRWQDITVHNEWTSNLNEAGLSTVNSFGLLVYDGHDMIKLAQSHSESEYDCIISIPKGVILWQTKIGEVTL